MIHSDSLVLLTDFYQLTMSYGYWKAGLEKKEAVFQLFFRKIPFQGGFVVAAGLETVIQYLKNFHFSDSDLAYLRTLKKAQSPEPLFEEGFIDYLRQLTFTCDVDAVPEGTIMFPYEPLIRIQGPLIQCQILESALLNLINFPSLIATKAARICLAAKEDTVIEFGLRRAQGIDGALTATRASYIGGCQATSNVLGGKLFDIPVSGTQSHSWVMVFDDELNAFKTYAQCLPDNSVFLVDTYDTIEGVKRAIVVGKELKKMGKKLLGVRLDSGDLADLSIKARKLLDQAGFSDTQIIASNELDESVIGDLKRQGAQITVWGVGTNLVTAKGQSALDGVYKLSAIRDPGEPWKYKIKLSEQLVKVTNPGILQVRRFYNKHENVADVIYDIHTGFNPEGAIIDPLDPTKEKSLKEGLESYDLLQPIFKNGICVYQSPTLQEIQKNTRAGLDSFHFGVKRFLNPHQYFVGMEKRIHDLKHHLIRLIRSQTSHAYIVPDEL